jgi:toxin YhaV
MARSKPANRTRGDEGRTGTSAPAEDAPQLLTRHGWTILAHPLFLGQLSRLAAASAAEQRAPETGRHGPNTKLLAHVIDLAFDTIPRGPGQRMFRQGGTLGAKRTHWFRAKTGNGRFRLFFRYHSAAKLIVLAWINDRESLRTYGSPTDAYHVFGKMLDAGNPPDSWEALLEAAQSTASVEQLNEFVQRFPHPDGVSFGDT